MFALGGAIQWINYRALAPSLAWGVLLAALANMVIGWLQFLGVAPELSPWVNQVSAPGQVYGNIRQPNQYASLMAMGLASLWWVAYVCPARHRWSVVVGTLLLVSGTVLSGSRTGVLELLVLAIAAGCWRFTTGTTRRWLSNLYIALPLVYLIELALIKGMSQSLGTVIVSGMERFADTSGAGRTSLWRDVLRLITDHPVRGYGIHELGYTNFSHDYLNTGSWFSRSDPSQVTFFIDNAHNAVLQSWVELGLIGMLLSVGALAFGAWRMRPWREARIDQQMAWLIIAVLTLHSMLEYPLHYAQFWLPFCFALAITFAKYPYTATCIIDFTNDINGYFWRRNGSIYISALLSLFCLCSFAYAAWDYDRVSQAYNGPHRREVPQGLDRIAEAQKSWLFAPYARFAKLMVTPITSDNAAALLPELQEMLHFSAEPRVLDKLLLALKLTAQNYPARIDEIALLERRYAAAFPDEYAHYRAQQPISQ
jgi:O-antigen ligase